jgi:hypothetical protein
MGTYFSTGSESFFTGSKNTTHTHWIITPYHPLDTLHVFGTLINFESQEIHIANSLSVHQVKFTGDGIISLEESPLGNTTLLITDTSYVAISGYSDIRNIILNSNTFLLRSVGDTFINTPNNSALSIDTSMEFAYLFPVSTTSGIYAPLALHFLSISDSLEDISTDTLGNLLRATGKRIIAVGLRQQIESIAYNIPFPTLLSAQGSPCAISSQLVSFTCTSPISWNISGSCRGTYFLLGNSPLCGNAPYRIIVHPHTSANTPSEYWEPFIGQTAIDSNIALCEYSDWYGGMTLKPGGPYNQFGTVTIAGNNGSLLPITLSSFTARFDTHSSNPSGYQWIYKNNTWNLIRPFSSYYMNQTNASCVHLNWSTSLEVTNDYFTLERSTDGYSFHAIAIIQGHGNSTTQQDYHYQDLLIDPATIYYYRLKQTDYDGQYTNSRIISITSPDQNHEIWNQSFMVNPIGQQVNY